jgi:DUF3054 family protein
MTAAPDRLAARPIVLVAAVDVLAVLLFTIIGQRSHAEALDAIAVLRTAAPFLLGLLAGWLIGRVWRAPARLSAGVAAWAGAAVIGLAVRAAFTHRLPLSFVLIAAASLAVVLLGWRLVALAVARMLGRTA